MQIKEFDIILDIKDLSKVKFRNPATQTPIEEIIVIREDYLGNQFNIYLEDDGQPYQIGENNVDIVFRKHGNTTIVMSTETNNVEIIDNVIKCILSTNAMAISGRQVQTEIIVRDIDGRQLTSARFGFRVKKGLLTNDIIESTNELPLLNQLIEQVETLETSVVNNINDSNSELNTTIANSKTAKTSLIETIESSGIAIEDVNTLKGVRIHISSVPPVDTPFWYDPTDN